MTCEIPSTSMPRAATSVATSVSTAPDSKRARAFSRWRWVLSPCIATAGTPALPRRRTRRSAPRFVRTKTSARSRSDRSSPTRASSRPSRSTATNRCSIVVVAVLGEEALGGGGGERPPVEQVLQAPGRRDQELGAARGAGLLLEADAAVDRGDPQPSGACDRARLVHDLGGELAGRREDERARPAAARCDPLDDRDREGERLAGAGRRLGEDVAAGEDVGDDEPLDGERLGDVAPGGRAPDGGGHAEIGEGRLGHGSPCGARRTVREATADPNRTRAAPKQAASRLTPCQAARPA